ncbi:hypothetical protein MSAS_16980 [Mycobacterium saskatchewanense]|uniref:hypothetical protein n=1 Tax=Mycobacterium saskatchewanense TaxID=220927 RepID=UPI0013023149|nr:hypothetical protein [Mycobacterium saskatchewanense]BBX62524.1 hypothetical protein MSAS_16980 [Mycobacterium saskatchewanense]
MPGALVRGYFGAAAVRVIVDVRNDAIQQVGDLTADTPPATWPVKSWDVVYDVVV